MLINRKFLHYLLWILIFIQGFVQLSNLPTAIYRIGVPLIILLLFLDKLYTNRESFKAPLLPLVIIFVMVSFISSLLNKVSYFNLMYFYIYTIQNYIYFLIIYNEIDVFILKKIGNLIILLFFIQIPATFYKLIVFGRTEHGIIGTISTYQGSLSAIIPLFAITYLYSKNLFNPKKKNILIIIGFLFFSYIGMKRAQVIYLPILIIATHIILYYKTKYKKQKINISLTRIIIVIGTLILVIYLSLRIIPSLNPDDKMWGKFDIDYTYKYISFYTSSEDKSFSEMRRSAGVLYFFNYFKNDKLINLLFGNGAGHLVTSDYSNTGGSIEELYGVRYGGRMGFVWMYLQVGLLGIVLFILFNYILIKRVWTNYRNNFIYLSFIMLSFLYLLDFITYSIVFFKYDCLNTTYFFLAALIYKDIYNKRFNIKDIV